MSRKPYPNPLVIRPLSEEHTHTIISLHGRGSNAERFGHELLVSTNLQKRLPTVKFVFPTARKRRSTVLKKIPIHQWYDNYSLEDPGQRTDLQVEGLYETAEFIRGLVTAEARILGDENHSKIILWGLSQGCAAGIFTLLGGWADTSEANPLGAFIGMSGWLPFEQQLREILPSDESLVSAGDNSQNIQSDDDSCEESESEEESERDAYSEQGFNDNLLEESSSSRDDFDPFKEEIEEDSAPRDDFNPFEDDEEEAPLVIQAINHIRDILALPMISGNTPPSEDSHPSSLSHLQTPVFLGHGAEDPKVSAGLGEKMTRILSNGLGMDVTWKEYQGLGHWYRAEDEVEDILSFLRDRVGLPVISGSSLAKGTEQEK
ncbi:Phospholipase/carboxylesterase/thioesterase [Penicillium expansum]|uniref:Phospholipase/carboxylesterase/thioesterase n=1 Tax=Penicillium expansum TaxID=27334 RepID=A0A0A2J2G5_PENEN|nr:Phospholipase/carboxylesterase/thioesterase [Penicillium expansum]KGO40590.1 Phospholipase/carboxylesterase/thioesterase [Penicillium expansum]KGO48868.1 Phospholipase/carboxylesterase/thioesterase [Penicillium expansum]KGO63063.1 Phospholipase/carboxylesterase/thioesterase [Penicillium expansum]